MKWRTWWDCVTHGRFSYSVRLAVVSNVPYTVSFKFDPGAFPVAQIYRRFLDFSFFTLCNSTKIMFFRHSNLNSDEVGRRMFHAFGSLLVFRIVGRSLTLVVLYESN